MSTALTRALPFLLLAGCTTSLDPVHDQPVDDDPAPAAEPPAEDDASDDEDDTPEVVRDPVDLAIDYGLSLVGTPYGWWYDGPLPAGAPMWTAGGPAPDPSLVVIESANCTGLTNLMLRAIGAPLPSTPEGGTGGTYSYAEALADVAQPFDVDASYPPGTLLGRAYRDTYDQGHVAVVLADGKVLQSFAWKRGGVAPGVNATYTVAQSHDGGFYEYAVLPQDWLAPE